MTHAAESTHYYTRDGKPAYEVQSAKGGMRPTTLRDARKLGLVPSVTTIIKCAAAPRLEHWKLNEMLHSALTLPRIDGEPEENWIDRIWSDSKETGRKAADKGTQIHAAIQGYFSAEGMTEGFEKHIQGAVLEVSRWMDVEWFAERAFAHPMGFGGKVDLSSPRGCVVDFKTKEFDEDADLKTWDEHAMQLAAYRVGLGIDQAPCAIVYVSTTVPGLARLMEIPEEGLAKGWAMFYSLLHYWQAKNGYRSSFTREETFAA